MADCKLLPMNGKGHTTAAALLFQEGERSTLVLSPNLSSSPYSHNLF